MVNTANAFPTVNDTATSFIKWNKYCAKAKAQQPRHFR